MPKKHFYRLEQEKHVMYQEVGITESELPAEKPESDVPLAPPGHRHSQLRTLLQFNPRPGVKEWVVFIDCSRERVRIWRRHN
jgi:hypothetical protein